MFPLVITGGCLSSLVIQHCEFWAGLSEAPRSVRKQGKVAAPSSSRCTLRPVSDRGAISGGSANRPGRVRSRGHSGGSD